MQVAAGALLAWGSYRAGILFEFGTLLHVLFPVRAGAHFAVELGSTFLFRSLPLCLILAQCHGAW